MYGLRSIVIENLNQALPEIAPNWILTNISIHRLFINFGLIHTENGDSFNIVLGYPGLIKKPWRELRSFDIDLLISDISIKKEAYEIASATIEKIITNVEYFPWCKTKQLESQYLWHRFSLKEKTIILLAKVKEWESPFPSPWHIISLCFIFMASYILLFYQKK